MRATPSRIKGLILGFEAGMSVQDRRFLCNKAFVEKDFEEAISNYSKAIQIDPKNHVYYSNRR